MEMKGRHGDKTLRRIIQMLLSLGLLAERASGAPWPVRCLVLWILRYAEAVACGFVHEIAQTPLGILDLSDFPDDNSPAGALCLAMRFTVLAAALQYLLDQPQPFEGNIRQAHGDAGVRLVVRHLNRHSPIGLPGSRAPPPRLQKHGQSRLQSRNGFLERIGASL